MGVLIGVLSALGWYKYSKNKSLMEAESYDDIEIPRATTENNPSYTLVQNNPSYIPVQCSRAQISPHGPLKQEVGGQMYENPDQVKA